jgi:hypothetical protein
MDFREISCEVGKCMEVALDRVQYIVWSSWRCPVRLHYREVA